MTHGPARVAAVCNQKGGVGKTTTTINLGAALAEHGRRVLLVDFDPQGALSVGLGIQPHELDVTIYNLLMERDVSAHDVLFKTNVDGMDLLPSNIDLSGAEVQLVHEVGREFVLGRVAAAGHPRIRHHPDRLPALARAAHGQRAGLRRRRDRAAGVRVLRAARRGPADGDHRQGVHEAQPEAGARRPAGHDVRLAHAALPGRSWPASSKGFGDKVYHTVISRTVRFPDATVAGEPITRFDPTSNAANSYRELAKEVLDRWRQGDVRG